jgi:transcriptional regulator with XRE-family HTH domain
MKPLADGRRIDGLTGRLLPGENAQVDVMRVWQGAARRSQGERVYRGQRSAEKNLADVLTSTQHTAIMLSKDGLMAVSTPVGSTMEFGQKLRELRREKGLTLRALAEAVGVDFTYLSKIENGKAGYLPGAETIRSLAAALEVEPLELLQLANKVPPEVESFAGDAKARRFLQRAQEVAAPEDWDALLNLLERRHKQRDRREVS